MKWEERGSELKRHRKLVAAKYRDDVMFRPMFIVAFLFNTFEFCFVMRKTGPGKSTRKKLAVRKTGKKCDVEND